MKHGLRQRSFIRKTHLTRLFYLGGATVVFCLFQNFDDINDQPLPLQYQPKTEPHLGATNLGGAAQEYLTKQFAPDAQMAAQKLGERIQFSAQSSPGASLPAIAQAPGQPGAPQPVNVGPNPEVQMKVIGGAPSLGMPQLEIVNANAFRVKWDKGLSCDYEVTSKTLKLAAPLAPHTGIQYQFHDDPNAAQHTLSWQMSW